MHPVLRTVLQRLALGVLTLLAVSVVIFSIVEFLPGDFATKILGQSATPETVKAFEHEIGIDRPAAARYLEWISHAAAGDFGNSYASTGDTRLSVASIIGPRLRNTLFLAALTALIAVPLSLALGILAALFRNSWFDRLINASTLTTISSPEFFLAYILMLLLAVKVHWFPVLSDLNADDDLGTRIYKAALPALTLTLVIVAHMMRMTRAAIINLLASPYIEMARLKGIAPADVILRHALPNAWAPIVTVIAFNLAYLVIGVVAVEKVFVYPGVGQLMVDSVGSHDVPVVQACALFFASAYILLNLLADVIAIVTNPRLLHPR